MIWRLSAPARGAKMYSMSKQPTEEAETKLPEQYWHCAVKLVKDTWSSVVNDLTLKELRGQIVRPWLQGKPFSVSGKIVRNTDDVKEIRISRTPNPQQYYADQHNMRMSAGGITDLATNRAILPILEGTDYTFEMLFSGSGSDSAKVQPNVGLVETICRRIGKSAQILTNRQRKEKQAYSIKDEYDVQDLLHSILRAYLKSSVQEDPLPKLTGTKSSRADISIHDLGVLIEVKYAYGPSDQKRIFEQFSQDLLLYSQWPHLKTLLYLIYNSSDLVDPEALEKLSGEQEINGKRFIVEVILRMNPRGACSRRGCKLRVP